MGEFQGLLDRLSEKNLADLTHEDMGVFNLKDVVQLLRLVRRELKAADALAPEEIPTNVRGDILGVNFLSEIDSLVNAMREYGPNTPNPAEVRSRFEAQAGSLRDKVIERVRPLVRINEFDLRRLQDEARDALDKALHVRDELQQQQSALVAGTATAASEDLAGYYSAQATSHGGAARRYLQLGALAGVALTLLTLYFLLWNPPNYSTASTSAEQWIEVSRETVARLALLSIAGFALAFCVRNYRVNMHLEVLNKRRENALKTFSLLQAAVTTPDARNIVVSELVRAVFTSEETGFLGADTERTVIESPGGAGMLSAMTAMTRNQS